MWGTQSDGKTEKGWQGITPTYVGNTGNSFFPPCRFWDHPHVCGEHELQVIPVAVTIGSPPRMWGTQSDGKTEKGWQGITPTYVGNTGNSFFPPCRFWDHPHVCGEHELQVIPVAVTIGSPPRMWGTRSLSPGSSSTSRITPTYVGNTTAFLFFLPGGKDHPHVCGEHLAARTD